MQDFYTQIDMEEKDILKRLRKMFLLKLQLTNKYPAIFDFVSSAYFEKDPVVSSKINKYSNEMFLDTQKKILKDIDLSLFKENNDIQKVIDIIIYTLRGYSEAQDSEGKLIEDYNKEHKRYIREIDEYITVLRNAFYK